MTPLRVYKFGGASVRDDVSFRQVEKIIRPASSSPLIIVLSAMGKTTNALEEIARLAFHALDYRDALASMQSYHLTICAHLFEQGHSVFRDLELIFLSLEGACESVATNDFDAFYDQIVSFGEKISTQILHNYLSSHGIRNTLLDATRLVRCDHNHRAANVNWEETISAVMSAIDLSQCNVFLVQGFIGATRDGAPVTLGREGSDYSAAIFGSILDASEVTIWKDVPGIMNADPHEGPASVTYLKMPYREAIELSFYGAKVIHPKTIKPLENKNIPLYVKPFADPTANGTRISADPEIFPKACSVIRKREQQVFTLLPKDLSFIAEAHIHSILGVLCDLGVHTNLMQSSALHFTFCTDAHVHLADELANHLGKTFFVKHNDGLSLLTLRHFTQDDVFEQTRGFEVLMEQRTRITYQAVVR